MDIVLHPKLKQREREIERKKEREREGTPRKSHKTRHTGSLAAWRSRHRIRHGFESRQGIGF
jgi:hypothetical protein